MALDTLPVSAPRSVSHARLKELFETLDRGDRSDLDAYLEEICLQSQLDGTEVFVTCYSLKLDGNGRSRVHDLAAFVADHVVEYCIPRSEIRKAIAHEERTNSTRKRSELERKARDLFTDIENSGEGGEMLLYILSQQVLGYPQLLCKMPLKTNSRVHYHGIDGIHAAVTPDGGIGLYWCESKLYADLDGGITACLDSVKDFIVQEGATADTRERYMQLLTTNLDFDNIELEEAMLSYLDKDNPLYNSVIYKGIGLVGFDWMKYPRANSGQTIGDLKSEALLEVEQWKNKVSARLGRHDDLSSYELQVFLIPMPSVEHFRESFIQNLR